MLTGILTLGATLCALQAIRAGRLLGSALWLGATSALLAIVLYRFGAATVAVIELSVGAGLVTVLFVFAIAIAGEDAMGAPAVVPRRLAWSLVALALILLGGFVLGGRDILPGAAEPDFTAVLWQERALDVVVQIVLLFGGVLGVLGLLNSQALAGGHPKAQRGRQETEAARPEAARQNSVRKNGKAKVGA